MHCAPVVEEEKASRNTCDRPEHPGHVRRFHDAPMRAPRRSQLLLLALRRSSRRAIKNGGRAPLCRFGKRPVCGPSRLIASIANDHLPKPDRGRPTVLAPAPGLDAVFISCLSTDISARPPRTRGL
jgi:hypothetical protein